MNLFGGNFHNHGPIYFIVALIAVVDDVAVTVDVAIFVVIAVAIIVAIASRLKQETRAEDLDICIPFVSDEQIGIFSADSFFHIFAQRTHFLRTRGIMIDILK